AAFAGRRVDIHSWSALGGNLEALQKAAGTAGHFNAIPDDDGLTRRVPMLAAHNGQYFESLSLAVVRRAQGHTVVEAEFGGGRFGQGLSELERLTVGDLSIPVDERAAALVPYRGARGSFPYVSAAEVIAGRVHPAILKDRIVLVGATAPGLFDLRATPVGTVFPGVEIHANLIAGMLDGKVRAQPLWIVGVETLIVLVLGALLAIALPRLSPLGASAASLAAGLALGAVGGALWHGANLVMPLASAYSTIGAVFGFNMVLGYFAESRSKKQFATLFGEYVPPALVDRMARDPARYSTEPRNEVLTVVFSDLRGFTTLAEALPPSDLREFLNDYLTEMSQIVHQHQGTVDKYIGDAIMAFWGAPVADAEHARNAVRASLALQHATRALKVKLPDGSMVQMEVGVGINTGLMNVGDMGSKLRRSYTVLGDAVNLASRLESLTQYYGVGIVIGERTKALIPDLICRELDRVKVKGKGEAVAVFEPIGFGKATGQPIGDDLRLWGQMLRAYRARDWDQAELTLLNMQRLYPRDALYELYLSRIVRFRTNPPPADWEGVTVFDRK
ncbi:MAG: adenylate/guanylate cyclase domain-containing protein, partial [Burkholderiales bacterium]